MNTDATRVHIDAETMAAWADRGLSADAAAAVELHFELRTLSGSAGRIRA